MALKNLNGLSVDNETSAKMAIAKGIGLVVFGLFASIMFTSMGNRVADQTSQFGNSSPLFHGPRLFGVLPLLGFGLVGSLQIYVGYKALQNKQETRQHETSVAFKRECTYCGSHISVDDSECPKCGASA